MGGFRGIGDAATEVIKDQNQLGMEAARLSETARQFDVSAADREKARLGKSRQFDLARGPGKATVGRSLQRATPVRRKHGSETGNDGTGRQFDLSRSDQRGATG